MLKEIIKKSDYKLLYKILSKGRFYSTRRQYNYPGDLRGRIAELILQEYVKENIDGITPFFNVSFSQQIMRMNGRKVQFGIEGEIDFLLAYHKQKMLKNFLIRLNNRRYTTVVGNILDNQ